MKPDRDSSNKRIILAITGASGAIFGIRALEILKEVGVETHLIISEAAQTTIAQETGMELKTVVSLASISYNIHDMGAAIASGSFMTHGMLILPCSIKTLSAVANFYSHNLIVRAADVCLKEGRPLILAVREAPFHRGHLRLMERASWAGAIIYPPIPFFYGKPQTLDDLITHTAGRMLLRLGIENPNYPRWGCGNNTT